MRLPRYRSRRFPPRIATLPVIRNWPVLHWAIQPAPTHDAQGRRNNSSFPPGRALLRAINQCGPTLLEFSVKQRPRFCCSYMGK